jgi:hypothetical protein
MARAFCDSLERRNELNAQNIVLESFGTNSISMEVDEVVGSETAPLEEYEAYFPKSLYANIASGYGSELFPVQVSVIDILKRTSRGDILCKYDYEIVVIRKLNL